jgi:hypothetical protein
MQTYNIHLQHIENTPRHSFNIEIHAGKTAFVYIKMANAYFYKGVLELSLALLSQPLQLYKMRYN